MHLRADNQLHKNRIWWWIASRATKQNTDRPAASWEFYSGRGLLQEQRW